jgi:glycine/D-amino acid oxidase-like deaminating enzyme
MTSSQHIVIIGAGIIGTSLAAHLAKRGERPLVLERDHVCSGTTGQSGGLVRQHYSNPETAAMARDALNIFRHWSDHFEGTSGFVPVGVLLTAGPETEANVRANVAMHKGLGIETTLLEPGDVAQIDPRVRVDDCTTICYEPTAGIADPIETNHAYAATARSLGVEIREGIMVSEVAVASSRVTGVRTSEGLIPADVVVNAAGAWGTRLMATLGHDLPITYTRHPMALIRRPPAEADRHPAVLDVHTDSYFLPRADATLVGKLGTMPADMGVDPDHYERGVTNEEIARYQEAARRRMPFLDRGTILGGWAGIYDDSIDAHPIVDAVPGADGLFCALGMSGNCFKLSPVIGDLLAQRIVSGPGSAPALDLFRFDRFSDGSAHDRAFGAMSVLA